MAGILTISKGHDAAYPWRQIGTERAKPGEAARATACQGVGYYLSPAERGGEPPGSWTGKGVAELGLTPGGTVDRKVFETLYGKHLDPRDPSGETRLGRAPGRYRTTDEIYEGLLAAEPHATAERREQLMIEAKAQVRTADLYWDATFSVSKSISLFHASALANASASASRGDTTAAESWQRVADQIWDAVVEGNAAAIDYMQREAGQTRSGYHPGGRWEDAREWVIASFRQHTSRDGDPQLHVHNLILHKVRRESDGAWRALDSMSLYRHRPAASAIAALTMENALTRRFGVQWVPRQDGHGREIADVGQALMDLFSSRRASIGPLTARLAQEYEARFGRAPDARALTSLRQWANHATRRAKEAAPLDIGALVQQWQAQSVEAEAGALEPVARQVLRAGAQVRERSKVAELSLVRAPEPARSAAGTAHDQSSPATSPHTTRRQPNEHAWLSSDQARRLAAEAVTAVQQAQPTWTEADLIRHLGERLPACVDPMRAEEAAALLPALARRALAEHAILLSAPEWPRVPDGLRRASGESLYVPHGAARYTTGAQLDLEAGLLADAAGTGAPRLAQARAARLLGADQAQLEAQLRRPHDLSAAQDTCAAPRTTASSSCKLRADQAAAAFWILTSARRAEVLVGPAGSGKTTTVAELARIWQEAGLGDVIGLATSQTAANVLAAAGVTWAYNTAAFLGHTEARREARGAMPVRAGSLLIVDEASVVSLADMAAILALARRTGCKVVVTGDHEQLTAVEGGGAMMLLARRHGYVQLTEPQRFASEWQREASLRLRSGDVTVLGEYAQHGRLRGGSAEDAGELAYRGWLADCLAGLDSVLIARTEEQVRELSRRARDDLVRYGLVTAGPGMRLAAGEQAGPGDLITARRNAHEIRAGHPGRALANRDVLRVTATEAGPGSRHAEVRRMLGRDPASGQMTWSAAFLVPRRYLAQHATLAYAATAHAALGRTTDTAHTLVDGQGGRQALYVAMTRGRQANFLYCVTKSLRLADVTEGSRRDVELDRAARLDAERAGLSPQRERADSADAEQDPVTVLAAVMAKDDSDFSATETLERELAHADHLGVLGGIWDDLVRREQRDRFEDALRGALPDHLADNALRDPAVTWLWRALREAETCGMEGGQVLREAVVARSLVGARDVARVLDSRVRRRLEYMTPVPLGRWVDQVPATASQETGRYLRELAEAMDDRTRRLGEHIAATQPLWARRALGPLSGDPAARLDWEHRAGAIAAFRERYGHDDPADPIGREPARTSPEARAAWQSAIAALGRIDGIDLRCRTDGELWLCRATYERETAWAPRHVGRELQVVRLAGRDAHVNAVRSERESSATGDPAIAARHRQQARRWRAIESKAAAEERILAEAQEIRQRWETVTESARTISVTADLELRRRHPRMRMTPLMPHNNERRSKLLWRHPDVGDPGSLASSFAAVSDVVASRRPGIADPLTQPDVRAVRAALGLTLDKADEAFPPVLIQILSEARAKRAKLEEVGSLRQPAGEHDDVAREFAWPPRSGRLRDAVLEPPHQEVPPSPYLLGERGAARAGIAHAEPEREAGT